MIRVDCMHPLTTETTRVAFQNAQVRVEHNVVRNEATPEEGSALRISPADAALHLAVIVPVLDDGRLLLIGRYRYPTDRWSIEFPRVHWQESELTWKEVADTNLLLDSGRKAQQMSLLGAIRIDPALMSQTAIIVLAEGCRVAARTSSSANTLIAGCVPLSPSALDYLIQSGEVDCGLTLASICLLRTRLAK